MKLEINDLTVDINNSRILEHITLGLEESEFLVLLGPSGCGKSTLLKTIAGINPVTEGTITLDGNVLNDVPAHKRGTVILFQDIRLFPNMSVAENVTYALRVRGVKKKDRYKRAGELLGISLTDHIIIGDLCYCSLKEMGLLSDETTEF